MAPNRLRPTLLVGLLCLAGAGAAGCASPSPWSSARAVTKPEPVPADVAAVSPAAPQTPGGHADSEQMQEVVAELQRLGALDPVARDQLTADLQEADPALWPGLLHQARAVAAYRQRAAYPPTADPSAGTELPTKYDARPSAPADTWAQLASGTDFDAIPSGNPIRPDEPAPQPIHRLPVASHAALVPHGAPQQRYPSTGFPHLEPPAATEAMTPAAAGASDGAQLPPAVVLDGDSVAPPAAGPAPIHDAALPDDGTDGPLAARSADQPQDWIGYVDSAIRLLENSAGNHSAEELRLRMLYLAAERYDDAVRAVPAVSAGEQDFWTAEFHGLGTLLDAAKNPDAPSRTAEAKQVLAGAASKLGELAPLVVRNLAFCTRVHSYGCFETFTSYKFVPEQRVLLYAEVDNFNSESTAKGYHTSLRSSYQIFDARGQRVVDEELASTEELCQNRRHDFFIVYDFHLPKRIYPGKHTLRLTIEDLKGQKIGDSSIDLEIVSESGSRTR